MADKDIIDAIADHLVNDHVQLMRENENLREPFDALLEDYEALIRNARRCAYDLKHCVDLLPPGRPIVERLERKAHMWIGLFAKGNPGKDYRHHLLGRIEDLERYLEATEKFFAAHGGVPTELQKTFDDVHRPF